MSEWQEVMKHIIPFFPAMAVLSAMELDIFTALSDKPKTSDEIAGELGIPPHRLRMLLHSLVATDLIVYDGGKFANSPVATTFLVKGKPQYRGGSHELFSHIFKAVFATAESVRTGKPQSFQDWHLMPDEQLRALLRGLNVGARAEGKAIANIHDFSRFGSLLDVGGGGGGFSIGACESCSQLSAWVVELPRVARISEEIVAASGLGSRIKVVGHDISAMPLERTYDAAMLRNFIQVLDRESARRAIDNVGRSLRTGGEIFIIGAILDDDGLGPEGALALNLFFLNAFQEGEAYRESEYCEWLKAGGFSDIKSVLWGGGLDISLTTAVKRA